MRIVKFQFKKRWSAVRDHYVSSVVLQITEAASNSLQLRSAVKGKRRKIALAFSLCRIKPRDCNSRDAIIELDSPVKTDFCWASKLHTRLAAGPHPPPSASQMMGINPTPSSWHLDFVSMQAHLKSSYFFVTELPSSADLFTTSDLRPLVTAKSKAAGVPLRHLGTYTSACQRFPLGSLTAPPSCKTPMSGRGCRIPGLSSSGFSPMLLQKQNTSFLRRLWRFVRSPPQAHVRQ